MRMCLQWFAALAHVSEFVLVCMPVFMPGLAPVFVPDKCLPCPSRTICARTNLDGSDRNDTHGDTPLSLSLQLLLKVASTCGWRRLESCGSDAALLGYVATW